VHEYEYVHVDEQILLRSRERTRTPARTRLLGAVGSQN
jgi:hypothetical protein